MEKVSLYPGQVFVTQDSIEIHSTLGSCVEVVLHDPLRRITGVSIFVQAQPDGVLSTRSPRYGCYALAQVLERMCTLGAEPQRVLARVLGGGAVNNGKLGLTSAGKKNVDFALSWLRQLRIPIVSSELGGSRARSVIVDSGKFLVRQTFVHDSTEPEAACGNLASVRNKVRIIIVENSPSVRAMVERLVQQNELLEVVASAADAFEARELLVEYQPDLVLISDNIPRVSGIELLQRLMKYFPIPVIMMTSSLSNPSVIAEAFECGAVDILERPESICDSDLSEYGVHLQSKILAVARIANRVTDSHWNRSSASVSASRLLESVLGSVEILLLGGDTGAHFELEPLFRAMPEDGPAILLAVEALPRNYVDRLLAEGRYNLKEARHLQALTPGCIYFPPEGYFLELLSLDGVYKLGLSHANAGWKGLSSREALFQSALRCEASDTKLAAMLLSGLSVCGVESLVRLRDSGVSTLALDPSSSRVPILPSSALVSGAVDVTIEMEQQVPTQSGDSL